MRKIIYQLHKVLGKNFLQVVINCFHFSTRIQKILWKTLQDAKTVMIFLTRWRKCSKKFPAKRNFFLIFSKVFAKTYFPFYEQAQVKSFLVENS